MVHIFYFLKNKTEEKNRTVEIIIKSRVGIKFPVTGTPELVLGRVVLELVAVGLRVIVGILVGTKVGDNVGVVVGKDVGVGVGVRVTLVADDEAEKAVLLSAAKTTNFLEIVFKTPFSVVVTVIVCSPGVKSDEGDQFHEPSLLAVASPL